MNKEEVLGAFSLVRNPIVLTEEEIKDVQKAIKELQQENRKLKKRNIEIYNGFMAITEELSEYAEENQQLKETINNAIRYINENVYEDDKDKLLDILKKIQ